MFLWGYVTTRSHARTLLFTAGNTVERIMGRRAADAGRLATAIQWYLRAGDAGCVSWLADSMLKSYVKDREFPLQGLDALFGSALLQNERLTFIGEQPPPRF